VIEEMTSRVAFSKLMNAKPVVCTSSELVAIVGRPRIAIMISVDVVALDFSDCLVKTYNGEVMISCP